MNIILIIFNNFFQTANDNNVENKTDNQLILRDLKDKKNTKNKNETKSDQKTSFTKTIFKKKFGFVKFLC